MSEQVTRQIVVIENYVVSTVHTSSTRIVFEEFVQGAVFVPAGVSGQLMWWGAGQNSPAGASPVVSGQSSTYPTNSSSGDAGTFAPIIDPATGLQVAQNVNGAGDGAWYPIPAACAGLGMLKITNAAGTITNLIVCLKS